MHAYIITGGTHEARLEKIQQYVSKDIAQAINVVYLAQDEEHVGIDAVRLFTRQLLLAPVQSAFTTGIIRNAHTLTTEAQNALLKLLEEPPPHARIFLETLSADGLLPTVVSRCESMRLTEVHSKPDSASYHDILTLFSKSRGEKLAFVDSMAKDRLQAKEWVIEKLISARAMMRDYYAAPIPVPEYKKAATFIRLLLVAQRELAANVNPKLVLDHVVLAV